MSSNESDSNPQEMDTVASEEQLQVEASKQMAIRHATAVAAASLEKILAATSSTIETVKWTRQLTELQKCSLQSELAFLDILSKMSNEQRLQTLFTLFDMDGGGLISSGELARCLKKMDTGKTFSETLDAAEMSLYAFDHDGDGQSK
jgi:Ca2+-binding EF-hand superfamily protein